MGQTTEDMYHLGAQRFKNLIPNDGAIENRHVDDDAGVEASKLQHQYEPFISQTGAAASATQVIHQCHGQVGTILAFRAGSVVACIGAATVTVDLKKNGTTVLSAVITLNSSSVAYISQAGTITVPGLVTGDALTVVITATAGGGTLATGFWCQVVTTEDAA